MKKRLWLILAWGVFLLTTGCTDAYNEKLSELEGRADDLMYECDRLNDNIAILQRLVDVIQSYDMITGITEIRSGNTVTGYRVNFVKHEPITIYNGSDGKKPLVASRRNPDDGNYYWTVQYGDEDWDWVTAPDGSKMLSIGVLPYVTIRKGYFALTFDGVNYTVLGKANGENGDQMFSSINTQNKDYVLITLTTGETMKIPTYSVYLTLKAQLEQVNGNVEAQVELIHSAQEQYVWIDSVSPILDGTDTTGITVSLSNGKQFSVHDWVSSLSPAIFVKRDTDNHLYWAYTIGLSPDQWVLSPEGKKISAESESVETPRVDVKQDTDGQYYWVVVTQDTTEFLRTKVSGIWEPRAVDSVARVFDSVSDYKDSLVLVVRNTAARFVLPKQYTVSLPEQLAMKPGTSTAVRFVANGSNPSLSLMAQGGFSATDSTAVSGATFIKIKAPSTITNGTGKVMAIFTFPAETSPITVVKTITISKED
jgi:hypothetical protein